ncbi:hypothetical protein [Candidatus Methylocalor cossyra]|uniref:HNH endonuclease n=1 Tax=Candidatus Methylocalor cossyra TaxID=3108543 RepID=A0ABM9NHA8_9GAMM
MRILPIVALALAAAPAEAADLPDPRLTPGATDPEVTEANIKESICKVSPFTWAQGHSPPASFLESLAREQIQQYGYQDTNIKHYQMDHLIPLSLGGHPTDPKNIWPQVLLTKWGARRKDYLEEVLHDKVCKGELGLREAQDLFRTNWIEAYKKYIGDPDHPS